MKSLSQSNKKNKEMVMIEITDQPIGLFSMTPQLEKDLAKAQKILSQNKKSSIVELKEMIQKYPHVTTLYNLLILAYQRQERFEEEYELIKATIKKFPNYFFAKINLLSHYVVTENVAQLDILLKNVGSIKDLDPTRKVFHVSEISGFYFQYLSYLAYKLDTDRIDEILKFLETIAHTYEELENKMPLIKNKIFEVLMLTKMKKVEEYEDTVLNIDAISTSSIRPVLDAKPFVFNHEEVRELCSEIFSEMTQDKIDTILSLPKKTLIEDLEGILIDIQIRKQSFYDNTENKTETPFYGIYHVLNFLSVLESKESIPLILDVFRQDAKFIDFWFADYLESSYIVWLLYKFFENDFSSIANFVKEENNEYRVRNGMMAIPVQVVLHQPQKRQEAIAFYKDLIRFFIENKANEKVIDHIVISDLGLLIANIEGKELRQDLIELNEAGLVNSSICSIEEILEELDFPFYSTLQSEKVNINLSLLEVCKLIQNQAEFTYLDTEEVKQQKRKKKFKSIFENSPNKNNFFDVKNMVSSLLELKKQEDFSYQDDDDNFSFNSPLKSKPTYQRNDKVTVRYKNGKIIENTKYKKVEKDVKEGKCFIVD